MKARLFFCFILAVCSTAFSKVAADQYNHALMEEIVAIDETCIQGCVGDKIYLNPDKIIPTDQGLFLNLGDENHLLLPMIYSDASGCYITPVLSILPKCPFCKEPYFLKCKNKKCTGKPKNK